MTEDNKAGLGTGPGAASRDRLDYEAFLSEYGLSEALVRTIVADMRDHADLPDGCDVEVRPSEIEGVGVFSLTPFVPGAVIGPARLNGRRTILGRRTNHARTPNCRFERSESGDLWMVADQEIPPGAELTINYRQAAKVNTESGLKPRRELPCQ